MDLRELYQEVILDHSKRPRNFRALPDANRRAEGHNAKTRVTPDLVHTLLGAPRFLDEEMEERTKNPGVAIGLAWTPVGGEVLLVEASRMTGSGSLTLTGQLGEVMRESVQAAHSYVRSRADLLEIEAEAFSNYDIHIHFPAGGVPKDGPSAGITVGLVIASVLSDLPE